SGSLSASAPDVREVLNRMRANTRVPARLQFSGLILMRERSARSPDTLADPKQISGFSEVALVVPLTIEQRYELLRMGNAVDALTVVPAVPAEVVVLVNARLRLDDSTRLGF